MNRTPMLAVVFAALPLAATAQIYRWVDAEGLHYSQTPPPGQTAEVLRPGTASLPHDDNGLQRYAEQLGQERSVQEQQQATADAERDARNQRCTQARQRLQLLDERGARRLATKREDGQYERWTPEQIDAERAAVAKGVSENCDLE